MPTMDTIGVSREFEEVCRTFSPNASALFALLAINEPINVSRWCELAGLAGVRETATRALSTTTLRPIMQSLMKRGVVRSTPEGRYGCGVGQRALALRWAASRADFDLLVRASNNPYNDALFAARIAIHRKQPDAVTLLERAHRIDPRKAGALALEVTEPFDTSWYLSLPRALQARLLELAMGSLERAPTASDSFFRYVAEDVGRLDGASDLAITAFAGVAVFRGELAVLRALAALPFAARVRSLTHVALAVVEGRYDAAAAAAEASEELKRSHPLGVLALLSAVALRTKYPDSERVSRLLALGARKGEPFQRTFRVYQALVAAEAGKDQAPIWFARDADGDALTLLWMALQARAVSGESYESYGVAQIAKEAIKLAASFTKMGYAWLGEQYHLAAWALYGSLDKATRPLVSEVHAPGKPRLGPSLLDARTTRAPWEIALDRLEALTGQASAPSVEAPGTSERILWRTFGSYGDIEPYIQKRTAGGKWTAGRKLAIKHLLGTTETTAALPPEDIRVAQYACEEREIRGGYPEITHYMDSRAWLALVGHPRVFLGPGEVPCQVIRGEPRMTVRSEGDSVSVAMDPPGLREGVSVREIAGQLVVFQIDERLQGVLKIVGQKLMVPSAGRERLLGLLDRLAPVVPVESTEQTRARTVKPDARPFLRLIPSRGGLEVALLVRPLGSSGPLVCPGRGAPTLLGQVGGEAVQTERDFAREARLAGEVVETCTVLSGCETGHQTWFLAEPPACLELVSILRDLAGKVTVEWPHGTPLRLRGRLARRALRGRLNQGVGFFTLEASVAVDGELSLELEQLLELLAQHPGRFVQLASGEYVELEQELRDVLDGLAAARKEGAGPGRGVVVSTSAISVLDQLTTEGGGLSLDRAAQAWQKRYAEVFGKTPAVPKRFQGDLRDYQVEGFRWLARLADLELGACLADDMGLGKTVQIIALLLHRTSSGPALIVAPTSVCENWRREMERFAPSLEVRAFWGSDRDDALRGRGRRDVVVTSYTLLQQDAEALQAIEWGTVVLDEAQLIKNPETLRAKAAFALKAKARVVATGTPVENHAGDLFSLFHFLNPGLLGSWKTFSAQVGASDFTGSRAQKRLLQPFILRRTKAQVLDDLPPITEIQRTVLMSPGEAKLYDSVRRAAIAKLSEVGTSGKGRLQIFAELTRLRRLCCHPQLVAPAANLTSSKLESFIELTCELVAGRHRILVFSQFTDVLALVRPLLEAKKITYQYLDGSTPTKQRTATVDAFQGGDDDVFLISLKAGGFGLNLTAADYVIHLDPWWNPAVEAQAGGRAHRIGQTRPVTVYRLVTAGTIEARIVELHREKRELAEALLADTDLAGKLTASELRSLLEG